MEKMVQSFKANKDKFCLPFAIVSALILRILIYIWLHKDGYFYGIPWDSFSRALISYNWSKAPFFSLSDGYWLPLQFWFVGSVYAIINTWLPTSEILVPVIINNLFFIGSLVILYKLIHDLTKNFYFAFLGCLFASFFSGDVFVSYTALSEPFLIFFILLTSYYFSKFITEDDIKKPENAIKTSIPIFFAAATHYIGWFLAISFLIFLLPFLYREFRSKRYHILSEYIFACFLCGIVPLIWLLNSFFLFGNPFFPAQQAKQLQAAYIGQMTLISRILVIPYVIIREFYPVAIPGIIAWITILFLKPKKLFFVLPATFILFFIWLSTSLAFSAPYQEPRYLVFIGWVMIPIICLAIYTAWNFRPILGKILLVITITFMIFFNTKQIISYRNSFDKDVETVSYYAKDWFRSQNQKARLILNQDSFAETGVIPLISGHPDQVIFVSNEDIQNAMVNPNIFITKFSDPWIMITKNKAFAERAKAQGLVFQVIGKYFIISSDKGK